MIKYLVKASGELISHCNCKESRVGHPTQMDCPWCGCGWLFYCIHCQLSFSFAHFVMFPTKYELLAYQYLEALYGKPPSSDEVKVWVSSMKELLSDAHLGRTYVILDGKLIDIKSHNVAFHGQYALHNFEHVPQVEAYKNSEVVSQVLANPMYWRKQRKLDSNSEA